MVTINVGEVQKASPLLMDFSILTGSTATLALGYVVFYLHSLANGERRGMLLERTCA